MKAFCSKAPPICRRINLQPAFHAYIHASPMSLLASLGVNETLVIQLGIFLAVYMVLKYVLFTPYFKAFNQRAESTVGQADLAERYIAETKALEDEFANKA